MLSGVIYHWITHACDWVVNCTLLKKWRTKARRILDRGPLWDLQVIRVWYFLMSLFRGREWCTAVTYQRNRVWSNSLDSYSTLRFKVTTVHHSLPLRSDVQTCQTQITCKSWSGPLSKIRLAFVLHFRNLQSTPTNMSFFYLVYSGSSYMLSEVGSHCCLLGWFLNLPPRVVWSCDHLRYALGDGVLWVIFHLDFSHLSHIVLSDVCASYFPIR